MRSAAGTALVLLSVVVATRAQAPPPAAAVANTPYADARAILESLRTDLLPPELAELSPAAREAAWPSWVAKHDALIRSRLERGDDDSLINFLLYGTSFTKASRATEKDLAQVAVDGGRLPDLIRRRVEDFLAGLKSPGDNERLEFARQALERRGLNVATAAGANEARRYLTESLGRMSAEIAALSTRRPDDRNVELVDRLTRFRDRGLSSDTAIFADFGIEQALQEVKADGALGPGSVRRVAIVGPGLDFTDKHEGYDFYPQQTTQPFAVIDTLIRLGLGAADQLQLTTMDLSPRVNHHLALAREQAAKNAGYVVQLPRTLNPPWTPGLVSYWERLGGSIGEEVPPAAVPAGMGDLKVRAVNVRPAVVLSITPQDVNIVVQRIDAAERFDLIVATNILAYYDAFEQSLALVNIAKMLRPGGLLLTNNGLFELPSTPMDWIGETDVTYMQVPDVGDTVDRVFWYRRE